ncbi:hypothetical protein PVAP13_3NG141307 [Panicum virgatum]|uniref:Uncharacterized protein n=1 Tax=Panicum virgatum TaxID=38727 RepID=A0A8T0UCW4_PANVG|nr:hypothetical protein PVAP13_3NG141307 [Panicum virgatum]
MASQSSVVLLNNEPGVGHHLVVSPIYLFLLPGGELLDVGVEVGEELSDAVQQEAVCTIAVVASPDIALRAWLPSAPPSSWGSPLSFLDEDEIFILVIPA